MSRLYKLGSSIICCVPVYVEKLRYRHIVSERLLGLIGHRAENAEVIEEHGFRIHSLGASGRVFRCG